LVSAIAINKALKKGGEVFLVVTVTEESGQVGSVPDVIASFKTPPGSAGRPGPGTGPG